MGRPKINDGPCRNDGCERPAKVRGLCAACNTAAWREENGGARKYPETRDHPLYTIWWERKSRGSLCAEWAADFRLFTAAVGDRPSPQHLLRPLRAGPYAPDNFEWLAALKREAGESRRAFNARKWASRRERFPEYEAGRSLKRKYGITAEDYARMLEEQDHACAICRQPETATDWKTRQPKNLAVDHCHETKKVRGLLCTRCNTSIGKFNHDPELMRRAALFCEQT